MAVPAHHTMSEDETFEELSDQQIEDLLQEAERSLRSEQQTSSADSLFRLPKLNEGHIADISLKTQGAITRVDPSKLINKEQMQLKGIKKIEDPIQVKKDKLAEVCPHYFFPSPAVADNYPFFFSLKQIETPCWVYSCIIDGF
jgi:hypothetical protein